jgi:hypothetical protein
MMLFARSPDLNNFGLGTSGWSRFAVYQLIIFGTIACSDKLKTKLCEKSLCFFTTFHSILVSIKLPARSAKASLGNFVRC